MHLYLNDGEGEDFRLTQ